MRPEKREPLPDVPFGTRPRRSPAPLVVLIIVFAAWFVALAWLAVRYPAR